MEITSWSHSKLVDFEKCKLMTWLKHAKRIPEPERPLPPGKTEHANDRGTRVHNEAEEYVNGSFPTPPVEAGAFTDHLVLLRHLYDEGMVSLEGEWGLDQNWEPTEWRTAWHRSKLDAIVHHSPTEATVIDYKGLPLSTPLPTPKGWTTMGAIQEGEQLFDRQGRVCNVVGKSKVKTLPCYRLTFDDTSKAICDEEHRWTLVDGSVKVVKDLVVGDLIPTAEPLELPEQELPLDPYVLGVWLADGKHTSGEICKPDAFIWEEIQRRGFEISHNYSEGTSHCRTHTVYELRTKLNQLGLLGDKQIPAQYLRTSFKQRLDLLRGIFDGDGSANHKRKQAVLNTTRLDFAEQVKELLLSLGQRPLLSPYTAKGFGKTVQAYSVSFRPRNLNPFLLPRKADKVLFSWGSGESWRRRIVSIELIPAQQTQCLMVDSPDHTFLCTENFIPTHNTGRKFGNEIKHGEQMILYQLNAFIRFPHLERVTTELWYLDQGESTVRSFTRQQGLMFQKNWDSRGHKLTSCTSFPANPNIHSCKYCGYGPWGTGHCEKGIKK